MWNAQILLWRLRLSRRCATAVGPNVDILVEGHNRFSVHTALQFADAMLKYQPTWFETPVPPQRISQMVEVAKRSPVPIACGEDYYTPQQFSELLGHDAVHIIQLEPQFLGLTAAKQVCGMVNAHNGVTAPHSAAGSALFARVRASQYGDAEFFHSRNFRRVQRRMESAHSYESDYGKGRLY